MPCDGKTRMNSDSGMDSSHPRDCKHVVDSSEPTMPTMSAEPLIRLGCRHSDGLDVDRLFVGPDSQHRADGFVVKGSDHNCRKT